MLSSETEIGNAEVLASAIVEEGERVALIKQYEGSAKLDEIIGYDRPGEVALLFVPD